MLCIFKNFGLRSVSFGPFPLLLKVIIKGVGILKAFNIAPSTGITIPIPSSADTRAAFDGTYVKAGLS